MPTLIGFLAQNGAMLLAGVTALLAAGCLAAAVCRSPVHRQRLSEGAVIGAILWAILACIPLPRLAPLRSPETPREIPIVVVREIPSELLATPPSNAVTPPLASQAVIQQSITATAPRVRVAERLTMLFVSGAVACASWLLLGHVTLMRLVRGATPAPRTVRETVNASTDGRPVTVVISDRVVGPVTWGARRPVIILPADLLHAGRETQLRQVLLHEAGHVRQGDGRGNLLFCLALPLLYFHPLYWWLRRTSDLARELVVDDWAARADGKDAYVSELVSLARSRLDAGAGNLAGAIGMLQRPSHFYRRMRMLLQRSEPLATRCSNLWRTTMTGLGLAVLAASAALVGVRPAFAQTRPPEVRESDRRAEVVKPPAATELSERELLAEARKRLMEFQGQQQELMAQLAKAKADVAALSARVKQTEVPTEPTRNVAQSNPFVARPGGNPVAPAPAESRTSVGGVQLDLVNLANSLVDASGAYKQAKITFEQRETLKRSGAFNDVEVAEARARLQTAEKRVELLTAIARSALESAKTNFARVKQQFEGGLVGGDQLEELAGKVKMLELIVRGAD